MTDAKASLIAALQSDKPARKTYSLRIEPEDFERVEAMAAKTGKNINEILNLLIKFGLDEMGA